jgi:uncharacterized membrane protein
MVQRRLWEIDVLRGIAVVAMVLYHFTYDLAYFGLFDLKFFTAGVGLDIGRTIGTSFIFLVGLSLTLSYRRAAIGASGCKLFRKYLGRGVRIFSYGLLITLVTWIFVPRAAIVFGVLHLIGVSIILAYPFLEVRLPNVVLGIGCIILGLYLRNFSVDHSWLVWLGTKPNFSMLDYWPVFPWFGVVLLGVFTGNTVYGGQRKRAGHAVPPLSAIRPLTFLGRHSLPIYLVHQPILLAALILLGVGDSRIV